MILLLYTRGQGEYQSAAGVLVRAAPPPCNNPSIDVEGARVTDGVALFEITANEKNCAMQCRLAHWVQAYAILNI